MTNSKILLLGVLLSAGTFVVAAQGCGDDTSETTTAATTGTGNAATSTTSASGGGGSSSTASSNGGGGAGQGGGGAGSGGGAVTCDSYCADIMANCKDMNAQYGSADTCKAVCATFDPDQGMMGNSLGCHGYHAGAPSMGMPDMHCGHAGPTGNSVCGATPCDDFCDEAIALCPAIWADKPACMTDCKKFPADPTYNATVQMGDSFACRMYHLTAASTDPGVHCPHIALMSDACN